MSTVGAVFRATLSGAILATDLVNMVFHFIITTGTELDDTVIATAIGGHLNAAFAGMLPQISTAIIMNALDLFEWDFVANEFDGKASIVVSSYIGTNVGDALPNGISLVMRFITEELRRQARKFCPGMVEGNVTSNTLAASILTPALASAALLNNDVVAGGATLRPCTFNSTPSSSRFETASNYVQTIFVNTLVGYQRGRQPGAGA